MYMTTRLIHKDMKKTKKAFDMADIRGFAYVQPDSPTAQSDLFGHVNNVVLDHSVMVMGVVGQFGDLGNLQSLQHRRQESPEERTFRIAQWRYHRRTRVFTTTIAYAMYLALSCFNLIDSWVPQSSSTILPTAPESWIFGVGCVVLGLYWLWSIVKHLICPCAHYGAAAEPAWMRFRDYLSLWMRVISCVFLAGLAFMVVVTLIMLQDGTASVAQQRLWFIIDIHVFLLSNLIWLWMP
jgi:hypothetical protein